MPRSFVSIQPLCYFFLWLTLAVGQVAPVSASVAFFYGQTPPLLQLCQYDTVVVDPYSHFDPENYCNTLSKPIAYVSLGEVAQNAPYKKDIPDRWVLGHNKDWNNNLVIDQTQPEWQHFFLNHLIAPLWKKGYRGFFFDTLDSYQLAVQDPVKQKDQINAMIALIQLIKKRYPDATIILNRGFHLLPAVAKQTDAVVIESLYQSWNQNKQIYEPTPVGDQQQLLKEIQRLQQMHLPLIVIDYLPPELKHKASKLAAKLIQQGLIPWITDKTLQQIYDEPLKTVKRQILILNNEDTPMQLTSAVRYLGTIMEYFGYTPVYRRLEKSALESTDITNQYAGIILWLDSSDEKNNYLLNWIQKQIKSDIPVVFLNSLGVPLTTKTLQNLGFTVQAEKSSVKSLRITKQNNKFISYEVKPSVTPYYFYPLQIKSGDVLLQMENEYHQKEDSVAITSWGGYALNPHVVEYLPNYRAFWVINPFEFFQHALRLKPFPVPDTTTENGRRLLSVHIDGDGFTNVARWVGGKIAAIELREKILKRFRIPTAVSVITGEILSEDISSKDQQNISFGEHSARLVKIAKSIFELPWVEIASHSFSHPFNWQEENASIALNVGEDPYIFNIPNYHFNLEQEITGSVNFINKYLAPPNKPCRLFFWSGLADPSLKALQLTQHNHLLNINGISDTNITNHFNSLTAIRPMGINWRGNYQTFAPIDMDFFYMNNFAGPLYGFEHVIQTWQLTNAPRRLKPIGIYYHLYAASYPAALKALEYVYRWALSQNVMPIYVSEYIEKVLDYQSIQLVQRSSAWLIASSGHLRELRSIAKLGYPDLLHSDNVVGFNQHNGDLYIHLGPGRITVLRYQTTLPTIPYLVETNAKILKFSRTNSSKKINFTLKSHVPVEISFANIEQCSITSNTSLKVIKQNKNITFYRADRTSIEIRIFCK